ncbi:CDP-alcohol phosphatidyltransferase family protein [Tautonia sociabilis]|uniref:CDP-alcohol phosphatidyltransferase family protein n=1 Tax=Tautonia sociabilis TaxID=2080755 RepID=A0A432MQ25_9BACT|nr:CDP-alcohol phosphatidyltransferase family protein [Tautonia sociabilis]RUL89532.1 CDP-alcohol phosphatidyltransferase family protein [Tautonia sociabilis]
MIRRSPALTLIIPNLLTFARFGLAAAFPAVEPGWRTAVLVLAAVSDGFDGAFSRLFHATSTFGQVLDPIADKVFIGAVLVTLVVEDLLPLPVLPLIAARDLAVAIGVLVAVARLGWPAIRRMPPRLLGKATTAMQFALLTWVVYDRSVPIPLLWLTGAISVAAGLDYLRHPHWTRPESAAPGAANRIDATPDLQHPQGDRRA